MRLVPALLALLVVVLVAVGAFLLTEDSTAVGHETARPEPAAAPRAPAGAPDLAQPASQAGAALAPTAVGSVVAEAGPRAAVEVDGGERVVVELVERGGAPLPGVELIVLDRARYDHPALRDAERALADGDEAGEVELLRHHGLALETDALGRAAVQWSGEWAEVHALLPWGVQSERLRRSRVEDGVLRFEVATPALAVRVVGPDGSGIPGLPVMFADAPIGEPTGRTGPQAGRFLIESGADLTDADGFAFPANAGMALAMGRESLAGGWVRVGALTADGPEVEVPPEHGPSTPVVVRLPPTAPVEVEVTDAAGQRVEELLLVQLAVGDVPLERAGEAYAVPGGPLLIEYPTDGRARFEHVALGLPLVATATSENRGIFRSRAVAGPRRAGETLRVTLDLPAQRLVALRVLDPEGEPFAVQDLRIVWGGIGGTDGTGGTEGGDRWRAVRTNREGRVTLRVEEVDGVPRPAFELSARIDGQACVARVELGRALPLATTDLGDVRIEPVAPLASGVVFFPDGSPAVGAEVEVVRSFGSGESLDPGDWWRAAYTGLARVDADGTFVLREAPVEEHLALLASLGSLRSAEVRLFERGEEKIVLRLAATGSLSARLVHRGLDRVGNKVGFRLVRDGEDPEHGSVTFSSTGSYTFDGLESGLYDLALMANGGGSVLHTLEDLVVVAGEACSDPRLDPIDLTDLLPLIELTVLTPDGEPAERWQLARRGPEGRYAVETFSGAGEVFLTGGEPLEGFITAEGHAPVELDGVVTDTVVTLREGFEVELQLVGLAERFEPSSVGVRLQPEPGDEASSEARSRARAMAIEVAFDVDGRARAALPGPGRYAFSVYLERQAEGGGRSVSHYGGGELEVPDFPAGPLPVHVPDRLAE